MLIIFLICFSIQILFWVFYFGAFILYRKPKLSKDPEEYPAVSVVICARNEATNLSKNLTKILSQKYPIFEVVLVDDASNDDTRAILQNLAFIHDNLKIIYKEEKSSAGKKEALALGLKHAKYDWFLLTDADAVPATTLWIEGMMKVALQKEKTEIVLGYGPYFSAREPINKWIRYETAYVAAQYFSAAGWRIPYMGVGRNLLYTRRLYELQQKALDPNLRKLASGDDDLFISAAASKANTEICIDPNTFMYSEPKHSLSALYKQKTRHYSTATSYLPVHQILLGLLSSSLLGFWLLLPFAIIENSFITLLAVFIRISIIFVIWSQILRILKDKALLKYILLLDILTAFYFIVFAPSLFIKNRSQWK